MSVKSLAGRLVVSYLAVVYLLGVLQSISSTRNGS